MTSFDLVLLRLLLAAAGSLAAGCAVWAVVALCAKYVPALARQRSLWLMGQLAVVAVFVAMLLPATDSLRVLPAIEVAEPVTAPASAAFMPSASPAPFAMPTPASAPAFVSRHALLRHAGRIWLVLYLSGVGHALYRWRRTRRWLDALAASGHRLTLRDEHAGLAAQGQAMLPAVIEIEAPISPMLQGLITPRLLLPRHLRSFDPLQQQLIVDHELTHWRRHDLYWSAAALMLQSLFWFHPLMRMLRVRLGWAQEFGCDRDVLRHRPPAQRKAYAAALVAQLKLQQRPAGMGLAFGASGEPTLTARVKLIRTPAAACGAWARCIALGGLAVVVFASLALQPTLALHAATVPEGHSQLLASAWPAMPSAAMATAPLDCTVIIDAASGAALVREGVCDQRVTPASTFKIAISLMGFDAGVLRDEHAPYLPYRPGDAATAAADTAANNVANSAANSAALRRGTDPSGWLRESINWYSQQVVARLGATRVRDYAQAFDYGNADLASVPGVDDAVSISEVSPTLKISPMEETAFLRKVVNRSLPVSARAYDMTARLLKRDALTNGWEVHGKTGTAAARLPDGSADAAQHIGWFVGWVNKDGRTLVFARLLQHPVDPQLYAGARARDTFLSDLARRAL